MPLRQQHLDMMRQVQEEHLRHRATITRPSKVKFTDGGTTDTPSTVAADVPCRFEPNPKRAVERISGGQVQSAVMPLCYFKLAQDMHPDDKLTVTADHGAVVNLHVTSVTPGTSLLQVTCVIVR